MHWIIRLGLAAIVMGPSGIAHAQQAASHQLLAACAIHFGEQRKPTQFTPVAKLTAPILPLGSRDPPQTAYLVNLNWGEFVTKRGIKHSTTFCIFGDTIAELRRRLEIWEERSSYRRNPKEELSFGETWPRLLDQLYDNNRFHRGITRSMFSAEAAGSVAESGEPTKQASTVSSHDQTIAERRAPSVMKAAPPLPVHVPKPPPPPIECNAPKWTACVSIR